MKKNKEDIGSNEIVSIEEPKLPREIKREELKRLVIKYISEGLSQNDSLKLLGIPQSTFFEWKKNDETFCLDLIGAEQKFKLKHLQNIQAHAANDWKASAWLLARKFKTEFSEKQELEVVEKNDGNNLVIAMIQQVAAHKHIPLTADKEDDDESEIE